MPFNPHRDPPNYVLIAGQRTPGLARIKGANNPRKWQIIDGYGLSGAVARFFGIGIAKPVIEIRLHNDAEWEAWHRFSPIVAKPPRGARPKSLEIWHPILEDAGINAVNIEDVEQPDEADANGIWLVKILCLAYVPLKPHLLKPEGAKTKPLDAIDRQIAQRKARIAELQRGR
jgi:hypothetical protein